MPCIMHFFKKNMQCCMHFTKYHRSINNNNSMCKVMKTMTNIVSISFSNWFFLCTYKW